MMSSGTKLRPREGRGVRRGGERGSAVVEVALLLSHDVFHALSFEELGDLRLGEAMKAGHIPSCLTGEAAFGEGGLLA